MRQEEGRKNVELKSTGKQNRLSFSSWVFLHHGGLRGRGMEHHFLEAPSPPGLWALSLLAPQMRRWEVDISRDHGVSSCPNHRCGQEARAPGPMEGPVAHLPDAVPVLALKVPRPRKLQSRAHRDGWSHNYLATP